MAKSHIAIVRKIPGNPGDLHSIGVIAVRFEKSIILQIKGQGVRPPCFFISGNDGRGRNRSMRIEASARNDLGFILRDTFM